MDEQKVKSDEVLALEQISRDIKQLTQYIGNIDMKLSQLISAVNQR